MTLKNKLLFSTAVAALLVTIACTLLLTSSGRVTQASKDVTQANEIVNTVSQVRFLTFEYLLHHNQRSLEQLHSKEEALGPLLHPDSRSSQDTRKALQEISQLSAEIAAIFDRLTVSYNQPASDPQFAAAQLQLQERLATQILIKQQTQITKALGLASVARDTVAQINHNARLIVGLIVAFMLTVTVANFFLFTNTVTNSLRALERGAEEISSGRFSYRIVPRNRGDEFGHVAKAFNAMAAATGQLDKVKSDFILLASHQLRTPLAAIKWYARALIDPVKAPTPARRKEYLHQIYDSNERMIDLVNKLLGAALLETGGLKAQPEPVLLDVPLKEALADVTVHMREHNIKLVQKIAPSLPPVHIDPAWARAIFQNLLSNAIRYSRPGQKVIVSLAQTGGNILISVADTGYGIPTNQQDKIFTKLFRADNAVHIVGEGSGLDLYITKALAIQAGGSIRFTSKEGSGSTFYVELPVAKTIPGGVSARV